MHRLGRRRPQPLGKRDCKGRQTLQPRRRARFDRMRFAFVEQRPEEPRDGVAMRDELAARASVERETGEQRLAAVTRGRNVARERVFGVGRGHSHSRIVLARLEDLVEIGGADARRDAQRNLAHANGDELRRVVNLELVTRPSLDSPV